MGAAASVPGDERTEVGEVALKAVSGANELGSAINSDAVASNLVDTAGNTITGAIGSVGDTAVGAIGGVPKAAAELASRMPEPQLDSQGFLNNDEVWSAGER